MPSPRGCCAFHAQSETLRKKVQTARRFPKNPRIPRDSWDASATGKFVRRFDADSLGDLTRKAVSTADAASPPPPPRPAECERSAIAASPCAFVASCAMRGGTDPAGSFRFRHRSEHPPVEGREPRPPRRSRQGRPLGGCLTAGLWYDTEQKANGEWAVDRQIARTGATFWNGTFRKSFLRFW